MTYATPGGKKELVGFQCGGREGAQSWRSFSSTSGRISATDRRTGYGIRALTFDPSFAVRRTLHAMKQFVWDAAFETLANPGPPADKEDAIDIRFGRRTEIGPMPTHRIRLHQSEIMFGDL